MLEINKIYQGDCLSVLKTLPENKIDMCITSPPYWALRDYGVGGQLGLETTYEEYINKLCDIFDEVKRVLKKEGSCWVVIGDTYHGSGMCVGQSPDHVSLSALNRDNKYNSEEFNQFVKNKNKQDYPKKSLLMIPFRFAIEMVNRGWILRNTIIWHKPNCMPSSVKDRFTVDFEYVFFFVKNKKYWFEQQFEKALTNLPIVKKQTCGHGSVRPVDEPDPYGSMGYSNGDERNKRTVWQITTKPFKEAHFAVYPPELIETPIKAGCPENGIVLDPFMGSGTTACVSLQQNKNYIGIELNQDYIDIANKRIEEFKQQLVLI